MHIPEPARPAFEPVDDRTSLAGTPCLVLAFTGVAAVVTVGATVVDGANIN